MSDENTSELCLDEDAEKRFCWRVMWGGLRRKVLCGMV